MWWRRRCATAIFWARTWCWSACQKSTSATYSIFRCPSFLRDDGADLSDVGVALQNFLDAILLQRAHAFLDRGRQHFVHGGPAVDQLLDRGRGEQQLVQADAPAIAAVVT